MEKSQHTDFNEDALMLMKALVWPVATYGCESWTLKKKQEAQLSPTDRAMRRVN